MNAGALKSSLYECTVLHERLTPRHHRFAYRLFYFAIDLDELALLHRKLSWFSVERTNLFSFRESDFLPTGEPLHPPGASLPPGHTALQAGTLKQRALAFCAAHGADCGADGRVLLVTLPRVAGYLFNPVSFYFCYDASGNTLGAIAEVTNTFHEVKPYFIPPALEATGRGVLRRRTPKHFYVSPFSELGLDFDFTLRSPGRKLAVRIDAQNAGSRVLHTTLTGIQIPLTNARLSWFSLKYPLITLKVITLIHWQALRLWMRRVPWFSKAAGADEQRDLYRPHSSINRAPSP